MILGIHVYASMELVFWRITKSKTEFYVLKCNGSPFCEEKKKWFEFVNIIIVEST